MELFNTQQNLITQQQKTEQKLLHQVQQLSTELQQQQQQHKQCTTAHKMVAEVEETLHQQEGLQCQQQAIIQQQQQHITLVHRNAMRLLKLVNSLLDFSRIEAGRMRAKYQVCLLLIIMYGILASRQSQGYVAQCRSV